LATLLRLLFGLPLVALLLAAGGLLLALDERPATPPGAPPTAQDVARAKALLARHDPRRLPPGRRGSLVLGQGEADLALAALARYRPGLGAHLDLVATPPRLAASLPLAGGRWLNFSTELHAAETGIALRKLRLGRLPIPDAWAAWVLAQARKRLLADPDWGPLLHSIEGVALDQSGLRLTYRAPKGLPAHLGALLLPGDEVARLEHYHGQLARTLQAAPASLPLPRLLAPLFAEVAAWGGQPEEARAALAVLGLHLAGRGLAALVPAAKDWPKLPRRTVTLAGRGDSAQHWAASALLAAAAGSPLAEAVGLWKELADSQGGSGFSFADLAADLAGTRAGEMLVGPQGPELASRLAAGLPETAIVPRLAGLPEHLDQARFRARYGGPGDPRFETLRQDIARRVADLPM
jgi:hypothetical protein